MKKCSITLVLLAALLTLAGCIDGEIPYYNAPPSECENGEQQYTDVPPSDCEDEEPPYFNLPTIESPYPFRVRYFRGGRRPDGNLFAVREDFYAEERAWLQTNPNALKQSLRSYGFEPEDHLRHVFGIRVVTSIGELAVPNLTEYTEYFFEHNYLVVISLYMGQSELWEIVHSVDGSGVIQFRPRMSEAFALLEVTHWTVIIELDNRFKPQEFSVVFIDNPWATGLDT